MESSTEGAPRQTWRAAAATAELPSGSAVIPVVAMQREGHVVVVVVVCSQPPLVPVSLPPSAQGCHQALACVACRLMHSPHPTIVWLPWGIIGHVACRLQSLAGSVRLPPSDIRFKVAIGHTVQGCHILGITPFQLTNSSDVG